MALSLEDNGIGEFFWETLDEVVAFVHIVSDFSMKGELVEGSDVFGEGFLSLTEVHELCHCSALSVYRGKHFLEFFDEFIPSSIPIWGLVGNISMGSGV